MWVILEIENNKEGKDLISFLKRLPFVKIRESQKSKKEHKLEKIFDIWKDKNITKERLIEKAWRM